MTDYILLGNAACGTIEPGKNQQQQLDELTYKLAAGDFHVPVTDSIVVPVRCVDGRLPADAKPLAPNAAGGSETVFVADDLTTQHFCKPADPTLTGYTALLTTIVESDQQIGGHTDAHAAGVKSGCGANDKLADIYAYIASHGDNLREMAVSLGVEVADDTHQTITANAAQRTMFSDGAELLGVLKKRAHADFVDELQGQHNEVAVVINSRPGTTLDRVALRDAFGPDYQAFNVDVWSFEKAAHVISNDPAEVAQLVTAMVYYNLATALVLAGPGLRVIVLK